MRGWAVIILLVALSGPEVLAEVVGSTIYEMDSQRQKVLFTTEFSKESDNGHEIERVVFKDAAGKVIVEEEVRFKDDQVFEYSKNSLQRGVVGKLKVKEGKVHFHLKTPKKNKSDDEKLKGNFIVGLSLVRFVHKNWDKLVSGESIKIRFAVLERIETVGFKLFRHKKLEKQPDDIVVKMKPSSFIISALVDPVHFYFSKKDKRLVSYIGRVKPKMLKGKKWKDVDAEVVYKHRQLTAKD